MVTGGGRGGSQPLGPCCSGLQVQRAFHAVHGRRSAPPYPSRAALRSGRRASPRCLPRAPPVNTTPAGRSSLAAPSPSEGLSERFQRPNVSGRAEPCERGREGTAPGVFGEQQACKFHSETRAGKDPFPRPLPLPSTPPMRAANAGRAPPAPARSLTAKCQE